MPALRGYTDINSQATQGDKMIIVKIDYRYLTDNRHPVEGDLSMMVPALDDAREAFEATHPAGAGFRYEFVAAEVDHTWGH